VKNELRRARGFTLIELLIVIALISILATMGVVQYRNSVQSAKEATLRTDLFRMRDAIDQYLRRQGEVSGVTGCAGQRRLHAGDSGRSDHEVGRHLADRPG
jgi:prepilin-type N-terminal cleavage/methylation domain-containing protein